MVVFELGFTGHEVSSWCHKASAFCLLTGIVLCLTVSCTVMFWDKTNKLLVLKKQSGTYMEVEVPLKRKGHLLGVSC